MKNKIMAVMAVGAGLVWFASHGRPDNSSLSISSRLASPGTAFASSGAPQFWPPQKGKAFPDFALSNAQGEKTSLLKELAALGAKVILIEPAALTCAGCHAFAGAHQKGRFRGVAAQSNLQSIDHYFKQFGHQDIRNPGVVLVQLLLYSSSMGAPSLQDATDWRAHFDIGLGKRHLVIAGGEGFQNAASMEMIPGFYLLDPKLQVIKESVGHSPKDNLYTDLLPQAGAMLR